MARVPRLFGLNGGSVPEGPAPWGTRPARERDLEAVARLRVLRPGLEEVAPGTWQALDLDAVFTRLDHSVSWPGAQVLFRRLRTWAEGPETLQKRIHERARLEARPGLRDVLRRILGRLDRPEDGRLVDLLILPLLSLPRWAFVGLPLMAMLPLMCLVMGFLGVSWCLLLGVLLLLGNLALNESLGRAVSAQAARLQSLNRMLGVGLELAGLPDPEGLSALARLRKVRPVLRALRFRVGFLSVDRDAMPELARMGMGWLNLVFLTDLLVFLWVQGPLRRHQATLERAYLALGELDADLALLAFEAGAVPVCRPTFGRDLHLKGLVHPLLEAPIPNDLDSGGRSLLITGSNMAGKTTYLRSVGVNLVLGRTLGLCCAEQADLPWLKVHASIGGDGRLQDGRSSYLAEVETLHGFLQEAEHGCQVFLIDEIFRGTNTLERLAAATAVLRYLGQRQTTLVTTHDVELKDRLAEHFDMVHFTDAWTESGLAFDHRLHSGPVTTRNALRLLEASGYPGALVAEARVLAGAARG